MNAWCTCTMHKSIKKEIVRVLNVWIFVFFSIAFVSFWQQSIETVLLTIFSLKIIQSKDCKSRWMAAFFHLRSSVSVIFFSLMIETQRFGFVVLDLFELIILFLEMKRLILSIWMPTTASIWDKRRAFHRCGSFSVGFRKIYYNT